MSGPARAGRRPEVLPAPTRETPVRAEGHCTGARQSVFLFGPRNRAAVGGSAALRMRHTPCGYGPFLFWQGKREMGGCNGPAIIIAESPGRQVAAPTPLRRRAPGGSRFGGVPQSSHSPLWASHHAGNAGSFGERVGLIGWAKRVVSFFLALNGWIKSTPLQFPK